MYPATVAEATALFESSLAECCAHPNDPSVLTSQFDKLVDFLVNNFPMPSTPDFKTKCSDLNKISFEDFKEGVTSIELPEPWWKSGCERIMTLLWSGSFLRTIPKDAEPMWHIDSESKKTAGRCWV